VSAKPITLCHPVWQLGRGGLERQLLQTIDRLPRDRFRHVLVVRGWDEACAGSADSLGSNVIVVPQPSRGRERFWSLRLAAVLRQCSVDVLHVRGLAMLLDSLLAARLCGGVKVAFSFHGFERARARFGPWRRRLYHAAIAHCDDCWAVSRSAADAIAAEMRLPASRLGVLANGVDTRRYAPAEDRSEIRRRLGLPGDRLMVLSVGNLKPIKGHDLFLQAVRDLGSDADRAVFVLVGGDYLDGELQRWAARHAAARDIRFVGEQSDTLPWYQAADIFVLPSRWEGLSNALLEAMSCGLPAIATAIGGNRDAIEDGRTGLLVPPDRPGELCAAILRLMTDDSSRFALARAAAREVQARFSVDHAVAEYIRRYEALAGRSGRAGAFTNSRDESLPGLLEKPLERPVS
jgi:glycosyltransferase involved in cell wall biosynthesis